MNFKLKLEELNKEVENAIKNIISTNGSIELASAEDFENDDLGEYFGFRCPISGEVFDVRLIKITKDIIVAVNDNDDLVAVNLEDMASVEFKITLLELLKGYEKIFSRYRV